MNLLKIRVLINYARKWSCKKINSFLSIILILINALLRMLSKLFLKMAAKQKKLLLNTQLATVYVAKKVFLSCSKNMKTLYSADHVKNLVSLFQAQSELEKMSVQDFMQLFVTD